MLKHMLEPTNAVILERLNNLIDANTQAHNDVNNHLKELNHQVIRHSEWIAENKNSVETDIKLNSEHRINSKSYLLYATLLGGSVGGVIGGGVKAITVVLLSYLGIV